MTAETATADDATSRTRFAWKRAALMVSVPLALAIGGGYYWVTGGRYAGTDNAYVQQDKVAVSADVSGRIVEAPVRENQSVQPGQVLFRLDPEPYRIALEQADAAIASERLKVEQMRAAYQQSLSQQRTAEQNLEFRQREFDRQNKLAQGGYAAQSALDQARNALQSAEQAVAGARQNVASALAGLGGNPNIETDRHPSVLEAVARRDQAALDLSHATVVAPAAGVVSQTAKLLVGQYMTAGTPALSLVETGDTWVEANFKETDLTHMRPGQTATVAFDTYPGEDFAAHVESIGAGTGSEFSLLPAQNATGNWVKVVQRVPVRLRIDSGPRVPMRTGLSASVSVDTGYTRPLPAPVRVALGWVGLVNNAQAREVR